MNLFIKKHKIKLFFTLLIFGYIFVFYGNFFGIDLSDEGLAILGYFPEQRLGIDFTHYQLLLRTVFPQGMSFVFARQLRFFMIILSGVTLFFSVYKSRFNKYTFHTALLFGATTLISLGTGIQILSYNALNQFIITLYIASMLQFIDKNINIKNGNDLIWLVLSSVILSISYIIRLPSFIPYMVLHFIFVFLLSRKEFSITFRNISISIIFVLLTVLFFSETIIPFSKVLSDVTTFAKLSSKQTDGHGFSLIARYVYDFVEKCIFLFFTAIGFLALRKYLKKIKNTAYYYIAQFILFCAVIVVVVSYPISVGSAFIFLFFLLFITYYESRKKVISFIENKNTLVTALFFPAFAISSTLGSNVWIVNLLLFYLSIWAISFLLFVTKRNEDLFKNIVYILVIIAVLKVIFTGFVNPHRQGSLLDRHYTYEMKNRGTIILDEDMYNYVTEIRSYLENENIYGQQIIAVSRLPGLVYLLDSTMPGSMNFTDAYWEVFCRNLDSTVNPKPVVIFRGNIPDELISCLKDHNIDLNNDYELGKVIEIGFSKYQMPTYIYKYKNN